MSAGLLKEVAIPARMRHLPLDRRGLPVPVIIMWAEKDRPLFAANDQKVVMRCFMENRCHICGEKLARGRWFISGAHSALAEHGAMLDGGLHDECAHYALVVCPYLAAPAYARLVGKQQLANSALPDVLTLPDPTDGLPRPEVFVAQMVVGQELLPGDGPLSPPRVRIKPGAVRKIEFWRKGERLTDPIEIGRIVGNVLATLGRQGERLRNDSIKLIGRGVDG